MALEAPIWQLIGTIWGQRIVSARKRPITNRRPMDTNVDASVGPAPWLRSLRVPVGGLRPELAAALATSLAWVIGSASVRT
jgi:hypothetical protein